MRLKSLDRYIKDKMQGYKPPMEADLWQRIEEKLPPARVPNGRGSWMLPVAAAVAIAILAPFTIKFYNITGRNQEIAVKNDESNKGQAVIHIQRKSNGSISSGAVLSSGNSNPYNSISSNTNPYNSVSLLSGNATSEFNGRHIPGAGTRQLIVSGKTRRSFVSTKRKQYLASAEGKSYSTETTNDVQNIANQPNAQSVQIASSEKLSGKELMGYIFPKNSLIGSNANDNISKKNETKYPDRKNPHPLNNDRWENWQSIYYPFWDNPAYTGSEGKVNITADYKSDNISDPGSRSSRYTYTNIGADYYSSALGLGVGLYRLSELSPFSLQNTYGLALSKSVLRIGSTSIKIGVSGNSIDNNIFFNQLNYPDQVNPLVGFIKATNEKNIAGTTQAFGVNGGLWISNPRLVAGLDVTDINEPRLGFSSDALALPRQWRTLLGYRFAISSDWQFMPMAIITRENKVDQANAMFTVVFKDKFMLSIAYQNIDPVSGLGNPYIYGAVNIAKKVRVFASYGNDLALQQTGINETFVHVGLKCLVVR